MIVYAATKDEFLKDVFEDQPWDNSMKYMYLVLSDNEIPSNAGVAIEFKIPHTSKLVDFLISGKDHNHNNSVVIVELKQWDKVEKVEGKEAIVKTVINRHMVETTHPSYQAWSYASLIKD
jgi:uncharacterized protein